eukprot:Sspe_Gene.91856::Locus_63487_Transcript_1_1_Confidence_1.000_Length_843::g.91856::m.91856/K05307/THTPA; thiamine-triphosphatase
MLRRAVLLRRSWGVRGYATEVEQKFVVDADFSRRLARLDGAEGLGTRQIVDVYYDTAGWALAVRDVWVRQRGEGGEWEMKIPGVGHSGSLYVYREVTGGAAVDAELVKLVGMKRDSLVKLMTVLTYRTSFRVDGLTVDVDAIGDDRQYHIAEIEAMVSDAEEVEEATRRIRRLAVDRLGFPPTALDTPILGKLSYTMQSQLPALYATLQAKGAV